jgi:hypothetical protein
MKKTFICLLFTSLFNVVQAQSDAQAVAIAKNVLKAMGGQKNYDKTRHLSWNFFGARTLTWDKWTGDVRIDVPKDNTTYLINVNKKTGKVLLKGQEVVAAADSMQKLIKNGHDIWINDSYWLVMPFKMLDPGVTLKYIGQEKTAEGVDAEVIEMTFAGVGVTPNNKYKIYVDPKTNLVVQWAFFSKYSDEKPGFVRPWGDYKPFGKILLSAERGPRDLTDVKVFAELPASVYQDFVKPSL